MVMIKDREGNDAFSVSSEYHEFISRCKEKISTEEDSMVLGIIYGKKGSGKSLRAMHLGYAINPSINLDKIAFNKDEFISAVLDSRKESVIGDEGISLFFNRQVMTKEGREMSELSDQIRQKNLCVLICVPKLLTIDSNLLEDANFVAYIWESTKEKNGRNVRYKGHMAIYPTIPDGHDYKADAIRYLKVKKNNPNKFMPIPVPWHTETGSPIGETFKKPWYPVDEAAYRRKKESILDKYRRKPKEPPGTETLVKQFKRNCPHLTYKEIGKALNISRQWANTLGRLGVKP